MKYQIFLLFVLQMVCSSFSNIRTGILKADLNSATKGTFNLTFASSLPTNSYSLMTTVGYIPTFDNSKGIYMNASCSQGSRLRTGLSCEVLNSLDNSINIAYFAYIVSDQKDFFCGTHTLTVYMSRKYLNKRITINPPLKETALTSERKNMINSRVFISGVSSADGDFSLSFGQNTLYLSDFRRLMIQLRIQEFDYANLTITFGYMIFDSENLADIYFFNADSSSLAAQNTGRKNNQLFLYGVYEIKSRQKVISRSSTSLPASRRLQVFPLKQASTTGQLTQDLAVSSKTTSSTDEKAKLILSYFRNYELVEHNIIPRLILLDPAPPAQLFSSDKILILSDLTQRDQISLENSFSLENNLTTKKAFFQDKYVFNRLFSTNGFIILNSASSIDSIYYFEITSLDVSPSTQQRPFRLLTISSEPPVAQTPINTPDTVATSRPQIIYQSILRSYANQVAPPCEEGVVFKALTRIDYIQQGYLYTCLKCNDGQSLDYDRKRCIPMEIPNENDNFNDPPV